MASESPRGKKDDSKRENKENGPKKKKQEIARSFGKNRDGSFRDVKSTLLDKLPEITEKADETRRLLNEMQGMQEKVEALLQEVKEKTGMSLHEVAAFLGNPKNFNATEWERIKKRKEEFEKKFFGSVKEKLQKKTSGSIGPISGNAATVKKSKPPSARRKWLPMS